MWVKIIPSTLWSRKSETQVLYYLKSSVESFAIVPFHYWILTIKYALSFFKCTSLFHPIVPFGYFGIVEYILKRITAFYGTKYSIYSQVCQIWNWKQAYFRFRNKRRGTLINFEIFSSGYVLIKGVRLLTFFLFFLRLCIRKSNYLLF